jgi:hypothetical protein
VQGCRFSRGRSIHLPKFSRSSLLVLFSFMTSGNEQVPALSLHERNVIVLANALEHEKRR